MSKLLKFFSKNKKLLFSVIGLGLVLFSLPLSFIEAVPIIPAPPGCPPADYDLCPSCNWASPVACTVCVIMYLVSLPVRMAIAQIIIVFGLGALIAGLFYGIVAALVTWLIGIIMSIGIVPGAANTPEVVSIGWNFTRQFANLFFLLALAFIGLATILRIKEYEAKKALPTLIITALLINFTPVIVGFVVDMGNIVTHFFLRLAGSLDGFLKILIVAKDYIVCGMAHIFLRDGDWWNDFFVIIGEFIGIIIYGVVLFIFFILAGFVYLLVGAVLFFRTIFLWILMILSPIAFLSRVFPQGRTTKMVFPDILHWDKWWEKLIQWTIIGIPIGFFLYLSNLIILSGDSIQGIFSSTALETTIADFEGNASTSLGVRFQTSLASLFTSLLAPVVGLVVLVMGMMISFKAAPEGAKGIMRMTTQGGVKRGWGGIKATAGKFKHHYDSARADKMGAFKATGVALTQTTKETAKDAKSRVSGWGKKVASGGGFGIGPASSATPSGGDKKLAIDDLREAWDEQEKAEGKLKKHDGTGGGGGGGGADGGAGAGVTSSSSSVPIDDRSDEINEPGTTLGDEAFAAPVTPAPTPAPAPAPAPAPTPTPTAPTPPSTTRKQKLKKAAQWMFPKPKRFFERQGRAAKFGLNLGKGVGLSLFKSLEPIITDQIDKEMGIGKHKKSGGDQKTKNCTICLEKINADEKFCSKCGQEQR